MDRLDWVQYRLRHRRRPPSRGGISFARHSFLAAVGLGLLGLGFLGGLFDDLPIGTELLVQLYGGVRRC